MGQGKTLACRVCKGASTALITRLVKEVLLFTYKECEIISAAPIAEIKDYLQKLGAVPECGVQGEQGLKYNHAGLEIEITACTNGTFPDIGLPRHKLTVHGDRKLAEDFLTAFRFKFLSVGG